MVVGVRVLFAAGVLCVTCISGYLTDWGILGGRHMQPTCVDIPRNMSLCYGIGYRKMRLPNLLEHDTMAEISQQASSWVPLLNVRCHPDTRLFLCSLFSPVCLERTIYPCRSLCDKVRRGCEGRMKTYGFPWPDMFRCDKFPTDNDMCISPQFGTDDENSMKNSCEICNQVETYENILDNFCRADYAIRVKIAKLRKSKVMCKKAKVLKGNPKINRQLRHPVLLLQTSDRCCDEKIQSRNPFLIMGHYINAKLVPSFIMPWSNRSKAFKRALRMFQKLNCTDPSLVSHSVMGEPFTITGVKVISQENSKRRKRGRNKSRQKKKNTNDTDTTIN